jgi:hypothetical protein
MGKAGSQKQQKEASSRAAPDARERSRTVKRLIIELV